MWENPVWQRKLFILVGRQVTHCTAKGGSSDYTSFMAIENSSSLRSNFFIPVFVRRIKNFFWREITRPEFRILGDVPPICRWEGSRVARFDLEKSWFSPLSLFVFLPLWPLVSLNCGGGIFFRVLWCCWEKKGRGCAITRRGRESHSRKATLEHYGIFK